MRDSFLVNRNRIVVLCLIFTLVLAFGYLWLSMRPGGSDTDEEPTTPDISGDLDSLDPEDVRPVSDEEFDAALTIALTHAADYGTYDETDSPEDYYERLSQHASDGYSENLTNSWVAGVATDLEAADQDLTGEVTHIQATNISTTSVTLDVEVVGQPVADSSAQPTDIGEFTMTLEQAEDGVWEVSTASQQDAWHDDRSEEDPDAEAGDV